MPCAVLHVYMSLTLLHELGTIPILQIMKLKLRELKERN